MADKISSTIERKEDGTIALHITIPASKVKAAWDTVVNQVTDTAKMPGFRPGKAPKKLVEESSSKEKIREDVLKVILPDAYVEAVQEHDLKPIINPRIHVEKLDEGQDWVLTAETVEMPKIDLNGYKENIKKVTAKSKIAVPGKEQQEPNLDEVVKALLDSTKVTIPQMLIDYEVDRLLSQTLDEIKRLGLNLDQYLASTNKSADQLRAEYAQKAASDIKLEFALQQVAEDEKLTVEQKELDEAVEKAKNPQERAHLESNKYLLASIIRQQKTLDFLRNL
jgi:FKBP-type peptidyl-prolyl cis-trans isomerase (trigger factor)